MAAPRQLHWSSYRRSTDFWRAATIACWVQLERHAGLTQLQLSMWFAVRSVWLGRTSKGWGQLAHQAVRLRSRVLVRQEADGNPLPSAIVRRPRGCATAPRLRLILQSHLRRLPVLRPLK